MKKIYTIIAAMILVVLGYVGYRAAVASQEIGNHKDKLWLHRANSLEKVAEMAEEYPNVEVDVMIRRNPQDSTLILDVTHDDDVTFGLTLEEYFPREGRMWLDIKNVNEENNVELLARLDSICDRDKVIVESRNHKALRLLTAAGYYTSCYVDLPKPSKMSKSEIDHAVDSLRNVVMSGDTRALSFPVWWYGEMKSRLADDVDMLTWAHRDTQFEFLLFPSGERMLADERLKVILVKSKGHYHR